MDPELADEREELLDKEAFANRLAETFEPREVVSLLLSMGLRPSDLALALGVHPRTVRAWVEPDGRAADRQRDGILALKALVLFLLRRGVLQPRSLALWLVEPSDVLEFRRPLAVFADEGFEDVINASAAFVRPEPPRTPQPKAQAVAAGAVNPPVPDSGTAMSGEKETATRDLNTEASTDAETRGVHPA